MEPLTKSITFHSEIPAACRSGDAGQDRYPPCILGVDEAGRGPVLGNLDPKQLAYAKGALLSPTTIARPINPPVKPIDSLLGPMVYAACYCLEERYEEMQKLGFADSKTLDPSQREKLFEIINSPDNREHIGWGVTVLSPQDISRGMLKTDKYNLNALAHDTTIKLLQSILSRGIRVTKVFIDTVGPPAAYQHKLQSIFPNIEITVSKKADSLYPIVSAASICAKVPRDAILDHWIFEESGIQHA
ncbi:hypothetical protein EV182_003465, partial [Spiromyces aspiralis]